MQKLEAHRWTREAYERMVNHAVFGPDERLELIDGEILEMTPQGTRHATAVQLGTRALENAFGEGFCMRSQLPLALDPRSEPEPDVAVVRGTPRDYRDFHPLPANTVLVVEISESTLAYDQLTKASLYARAQIAEYWILNLMDRRMEVCSRPEASTNAPFRWRYADIKTFEPGSQITPLAAPGASVAVDDLLP